MPEPPDPGDAALDLVTELLDRDEAYDRDPQGDPPIRTYLYRAALRAALQVQPLSTDLHDVQDRSTNSADRRTGEAAALRAVHAAIAGALGVEGPDH